MKIHWIKTFKIRKTYRYTYHLSYCGKELPQWNHGEGAQTEAEITCKGCLKSLEKEKKSRSKS